MLHADALDAPTRMGSEAPPAPAPAKVAIRELHKEFQAAGASVTALQACSFDIAEGEFVSIVGPSGCGKTTLLRIVAGLETPTRGSVALRHGNPAQPLSTLVFQEASIFPWMTVRANVAYGLALRELPRAQIDPVVDKFLALTGLDRFAHAYPYQLSGGMKQRASVARAFANDPEVLLMDEPFAALDEQNKILLQEELLRIWGETRKTVLFITHSIDEALVLSDRVIVMSARPGRIKADLRVSFPRPRAVFDLKGDPDYARLSREIWLMLREEVRGA
ncbi:ABC transporter ATP-binding protein [Ramlibacter rhizophilus]|uniref:ABC transporter ATP-binding protein n=1 Tax=Ramlibacter rhizophilus TaxID=1781167 RepID=A0A4Z0BF74_9BURK|nr:ABC transporter ATP-binding protein [Ramlibacter rhizophilus]TFY96967.1 ABC transporter ATP-binding protein [Ramlibacter rhizophilus]